MGGVEVLGGGVVDLVEEVEDFVDSDGVGKIAWEFFGIKKDQNTENTINNLSNLWRVHSHFVRTSAMKKNKLHIYFKVLIEMLGQNQCFQ